MSLLSFYIRYSFGKGDRKRDKGNTTPADVKRFDDISYGANKMQVLDVYRPANVEGVLPVIVSVHGGAWMYGNKEVYQWYCMSLAQQGFAVVNFTYRLAPEYKFPAAIEDTNKVFEWLQENAQIYGFDINNVFGVGDSAGGHLLAVYAAMLTNPEYAIQFDFPLVKNIKFNAIALNCGKYDTVHINEKDKSQRQLLKGIMPEKGTDSELHWICPLDHMTDAFPPAYIMTAEADFLRDEAPKMCDRLTELGVEHLYKMYGTKENPLCHVFHCDMKRPEAKVCNEEECQFFKDHLS